MAVLARTTSEINSNTSVSVSTTNPVVSYDHMSIYTSSGAGGYLISNLANLGVYADGCAGLMFFMSDLSATGGTDRVAFGSYGFVYKGGTGAGSLVLTLAYASTGNLSLYAVDSSVYANSYGTSVARNVYLTSIVFT